MRRSPENKRVGGDALLSWCIAQLGLVSDRATIEALSSPMPKCRSCGCTLVRVHRGRFEKVLYAAAFRCRHCARRARVLRANFAIPLFTFSRHTTCRRCGSADVRRLSGRDHVQSVSDGVLSALLRLAGAPANWCASCRLQYYDWRSPRQWPDPSTGELPDPTLRTPIR